MKTTTRMGNMIQDVLTMFKRCMLMTVRNIDALFTGIAQPALLMFLFVYVFGGAMNVGNIDYVNYIVPGVILQCIGQCAGITAISVNNDLKKGIIDRFRSLPIAKSSVLIGHALAAVVRNVITTVLIIIVALLIGFRPTANLIQWLAAMGILFLYILAITWLSIIFGLISSSAESAQGLTIVCILLPYISSGFVTTETMPAALRIFAENQPLTPIIESVRALLLNTSPDGKILISVIWCLGILFISYIIAVQLYKHKLSK